MISRARACFISIEYECLNMRTTLNIDDDLLKRASDLTGVTEKASLVRLGLQALIARETARRLIGLGGAEKARTPISRRRMK